MQNVDGDEKEMLERERERIGKSEEDGAENDAQAAKSHSLPLS